MDVEKKLPNTEIIEQRNFADYSSYDLLIMAKKLIQAPKLDDLKQLRAHALHRLLNGEYDIDDEVDYFGLIYTIKDIDDSGLLAS